MSTHLRLALALTLSGLVLGATAGGAWAFWGSALLWSAPLLIAIRCLPLALALPTVFVVAAASRLVAFRDVDMVVPLEAAAALLPALLVDKLATTKLPRAGWVAFPLALVVTDLAVRGTALAPLVVPAPSMRAADVLDRGLGPWAVTLVVGVVGGAFGAQGMVHNWPNDPAPQKEREQGVFLAVVTALVVGAALVVVRLVAA